ncbi:MAG: hypothetical protein ABIH67_03195 [Candidatus Uhrbacteria bacterium]
MQMEPKDIFNTLQKHLHATDDVELILLKGHLILEQVLNELLGSHINNVKRLNSLNLMFAKKLELLIALEDGARFIESEIDQLKEINRIRNKLAHKLDFDEYHDDLKAWACSVVGYTPVTINRRSTYRNTLIKAFYLLTGILSGVATGRKETKKI